jgi:hypothetical protein
MGNNNNKSNIYNTYISFVSDLYKRNKNISPTYIIHSIVYENRNNIRKKYIQTYETNIDSPKVLLKGGSACSSPINPKNIFKIMLMENYIKKENIGTPRNHIFKDISDILVDSDDEEFIIII